MIPLEDPIANLALSVSEMLYVKTVPASASVAVAVVTAVVFSATEIEAVAPPPLLVITGD